MNSCERNLASLTQGNCSKEEYTYFAYGLTINSCFELPELLASQSVKFDVVVCKRKLSDSPLDTTSSDHCYQLAPEGMYLFWQGVGTFLIREGKEIIVDPLPEAQTDRLRLFLLGAALSVLLHQRDYLILHGSAVNINGRAVVFIGNKGWGKSTMAATFHKRGYNILSDDVTALDIPTQGKPVVMASFPQLKLWPDAVTALGDNPASLPQVVSHFEKRDQRLTSGFNQTSVPLEQIFVLGFSDTLEIKPLTTQEIIQDLLCNLYLVRFGSELLRQKQSSHLLRLTDLAKRVSISYLRRPVSLSLLSEIADKVEKHMTN